jgi:mannose-6-phosphate isomerase-like protein (cupin superfamily)
MADAYVVAEADVEGGRAPGDTALVKPTIGPKQGCELLEQRVVRYAPGRSATRTLVDRDDVLFVAAGCGTLVLDGEEHALEPDTGVFVTAGETAVVDNAGPEELVVVAVSAPAAADGPGPSRRVTVAFGEQPELRADEYRTFRYLVNQDAGCREVTQFVGVVQPSRAPDHSHTYDEVGYIVEGNGLAHSGGESIPLGPGSCFHLPPGTVHCIENTGPGVMRILGVFHPSGDPASRAYDAAAVATSSAK